MKKEKNHIIIIAAISFVVVIAALIVWHTLQPKTGPSGMSFIKAEVVSADKTTALVKVIENYDNLKGGGLKKLDKGIQITIKVPTGTYDESQISDGNKKLSQLVLGDIVSIMSSEIGDDYVVNDWQVTVVK